MSRHDDVTEEVRRRYRATATQSIAQGWQAMSVAPPQLLNLLNEVAHLRKLLVSRGIDPVERDRLQEKIEALKLENEKVKAAKELIAKDAQRRYDAGFRDGRRKAQAEAAARS